MLYLVWYDSCFINLNIFIICTVLNTNRTCAFNFEAQNYRKF